MAKLSKLGRLIVKSPRSAFVAADDAENGKVVFPKVHLMRKEDLIGHSFFFDSKVPESVWVNRSVDFKLIRCWRRQENPLTVL